MNKEKKYMPYYYYGFDWTYIVLVLPCLILSLWASAKVNSTFKKYSRQRTLLGLTAQEAAMRVLSANGVQRCPLSGCPATLTDHYDPRANVIRLSDSVYDNTSTAAIGVACHEAGHAVQYAQDYAPIKLRAAIIPVTNIGSKLAIPLIFCWASCSPVWASSLIPLSILASPVFGLSVVFQFATLPVEFNASHRALQTIESTGILTEEEQKGARKTLTAAAMTYVAATATALAQLLRLIVLFGRRNNDQR